MCEVLGRREFGEGVINPGEEMIDLYEEVAEFRGEPRFSGA